MQFISNANIFGGKGTNRFSPLGLSKSQVLNFGRTSKVTPPSWYKPRGRFPFDFCCVRIFRNEKSPKRIWPFQTVLFSTIWNTMSTQNTVPQNKRSLSDIATTVFRTTLCLNKEFSACFGTQEFDDPKMSRRD